MTEKTIDGDRTATTAERPTLSPDELARLANVQDRLARLEQEQDRRANPPQTMLALWLHPAFAQPHEQGQRIVTVAAPTFEDAANLLMSGRMIACRDIQTHVPDPQNPHALQAVGSRPMVLRADTIMRMVRLDYQPLGQPAPEPEPNPAPVALPMTGATTPETAAAVGTKNLLGRDRAKPSRSRPKIIRH